MSKYSKDLMLTIGGKTIRFKVTPEAYEEYQDALTMDKKTAPAKRFLKDTVYPEDKAALSEYLDQGHGLEIAAEVMNAYKDDFKIVVKPLKPESKN